ncbi:MAG: hypothetical protein Q8N51_00785 [Gammaproteobacteria bacterium]|nr:hypothetical protein [Gammaproteobacteria bacterium]
MNPKQPSLKSPKLRAFPNGQACVNCGRADGSVVLCHWNQPGAFGMGYKTSDWWGAHLCGVPSPLHPHGCHGWADSAEGRKSAVWWSIMIYRTQRRLFDAGALVVA